MITIRIKPTWPLLILLVFALIAYLVRDPQRGQPPKPTRRPRPVPEPKPREPWIIDPRQESRDLSGISYEDAIRAPRGTYSQEEITEIADRELYETARASYSRAQSDPTFAALRARLTTRRPVHEH